MAATSAAMVKFLFRTGENKPPIADPGVVAHLYRRGRVTIMLGITLGYGLYYTCRLGLSVVKKPLIDAGLFSPNDLGKIGSSLLYGYAFGKLTNGFLADHANLRRFFSAGLFLSALVNLVMGGGFGTSIGFWTALWALNGWFQGIGAGASATALSAWFSNHERGRYYGIWSAAHAIGEGLTFVVTSVLVGGLGLTAARWFESCGLHGWSDFAANGLGWPAGFWGPGAICVVAAGVLYLVLKDRPQTLGLPAIADWRRDHGVVREPVRADKAATTWRAQTFVFRSPIIWVMGLANAAMYVSRYAINNWGILYLQESKGYSMLEAGSIMGVNTVAAIFGSVAFGFLSDKVFDARRPPANLIFGLAEIGSLFAIFFTPPGHPVILTAAFAAYGFSLSGILASIGGLFAMDVAPKKAAGAAMGFIGVFGYLGAAVQDRVSGWLIESRMTFVDGVRHYDFTDPIAFWIGASVVSLVLASSLWRVRQAD